MKNQPIKKIKYVMVVTNWKEDHNLSKFEK
jgi:hypothetical protein